LGGDGERKAREEQEAKMEMFAALPLSLSILWPPPPPTSPHRLLINKKITQ